MTDTATPSASVSARNRGTVTIRIHPDLEARARAYGNEHGGLTLRHVIELALAEMLNIPPAIPGVDIGLSLCPVCEQAVIAQDRCDRCDFHLYPRPWKPTKAQTRHARATRREPTRKRSQTPR